MSCWAATSAHLYKPRRRALQLLDAIRNATGGGKLIVNLEGFVLEDRPAGVQADAHLMFKKLAIHS